MVTGADRRQVARLAVPRRFRGGELELHLVHVLDLSARGVRIVHREPLHAGGIGYVDLPPALGMARLMGRVVWTRLHGYEQTLEGDRRSHYESGIEFTSLTPDQQTSLTATLEKLQIASTAPEREASGDPPTARRERNRES